jgi:hypothetical protein
MAAYRQAMPRGYSLDDKKSQLEYQYAVLLIDHAIGMVSTLLVSSSFPRRTSRSKFEAPKLKNRLKRKAQRTWSV